MTHAALRTAPTAALPLSADRIRTTTRTVRALVGAILGNIAVLAIAAVSLLVVPVAAALVFLPPLLDRL